MKITVITDKGYTVKTIELDLGRWERIKKIPTDTIQMIPLSILLDEIDEAIMKGKEIENQEQVTA